MIDKVSEFVLKLKSITNEREMLDFTLSFIMSLINCESATYFSVNDKKGVLTFEIVKGVCQDVLEGVSFKYEGVCGWCAKHKKNMIVKDTSKNPEFTKKLDYATKYNTRSIVCVVLVNKDKLKGVFEFVNPIEKDFFDNDDLNIAELFVNILSLKIDWDNA